MGIHQITRDRIMNITSTEQTLRAGQIVQGKILKIYPNNKAQIQLGSQIMVAQLELALAVGEQYHFRVETADEVIHLKVIGEHLKSRAQTDIAALIKNLGLKVNRANINFVQELINQKIPFEKNDLIRAFSLLENVKNKSEAQQVLKEMIIQKLPITDSVFNALLTKSTTTLSDQMKAVLQQLRQYENPTQLQQNLINRLSQMSELPLTNNNQIITKIMAEATVNNQQTFDVLKVAGLIDHKVDFSTWKSQWKTFSSQQNITSLNASNQQLSGVNMPFPVNVEMIEQTLQQMKTVQLELRTASQITVNKWASFINETVIKSTPLSDQNFAQLKQEINEKIMPLLTRNQQDQIVKLMQNNPVQLRELLSTLQTYTNDQTYTKIDEVLTTLNRQDPFSVLPAKDQFLGQVRQMLLFSGLTHENLLAQDTAQQTSQTVKSMLIQMIQQGDPVSGERGQQLLHFINGLQLQSVHEMGNFIQASMQVPGEKLGLNNDLFLEFESKKTEDGKINPDYCRILFYLNLSSLKETIIDMQIQKRLVSVTVFNDHEHMKGQAVTLQPMLKQGLESVGYQLSNVVTKPLQEMNGEKKTLASQTFQNSYEGIEFRI